MTKIPDLTALWRLNIPRERSESAADKLRRLMAALNSERKEK